jgi:uncharacterized protein YndB with AHSA1/START domain
MSTYTTRIEADPELPTIRMTRDFDAPPERVFRAYVEPDLAARWLGPRSLTVDISEWDARTGGNYRYSNARDGQTVASFYGSFHEVRPATRLVQTFTWDGAPDSVSLDTVTFEDLGDGRTRVTTLGLVDSMKVRDAILASGMETGVVEGYEKLDEILAAGDA